MSKIAKINTVMSIDDERLDQILYKRIAQRSGLVENLIPFQLAEDALEYLRTKGSEQIDVILLDINMPRMNGFDFLEHVTQEFGPEFAKCVVVMLTTSLDPADAERAKQFELVQGFLDKPLTVEALNSIALMVQERKKTEDVA